MGHPQCPLNGRMSVFGCQVYLSKFQWFQENAEDYFDVPFLFICNHKALSYIAWHVWKDLLIGVFHVPSEPHWPVSWFVHWRALQTPSIVIHSSTFVNIFFKMDVSVHKASRINRCFDFCFDVELFSQCKTGQCLGVAKQCEHSSRWTFQFTK